MTSGHRETSMITSIVKANGADLYVERRGDGPPLLMIAGGGGDGGALTTLAGIMAASYTVITYDRRGNSRSPLYHDPVKITIAGQSTDAVAVLRASGFGSARIFGNSGGAIIALDLAAHHPHAVDVVVAHEPPLPRVLPDASATIPSTARAPRSLPGWAPSSPSSPAVTWLRWNSRRRSRPGCATSSGGSSHARATVGTRRPSRHRDRRRRTGRTHAGL